MKKFFMLLTVALLCFTSIYAATITVSADITTNTTWTRNNIYAGSLSFCFGNNVTLNGNTGAGLAYQWRKTNTNIAGATNASYVANTGGSYTVRVTNTATGCSKTSTAVTVVANAVPSTPTITRNNLTFTSNSATGNQWFKNGVVISGATAQTYTATTTGCYNTRVTNTSGCFTNSDTLCVQSITPPSIANNGQAGSAIEWTNEIDVMQVNVMPNPNNGVFELNVQNNDIDTEATLTIYNLMGQAVYGEKLNVSKGEYTKSINLDNVSNGVYFLRMTFNDKMIERKMVINK